MKNFTNNFKQFTSRLSARWLIMALMMLVGTSSAWGAIYLKGSFNGWNESNVFDGNGHCKITLSKGDYTFKIHDNGSWYGNGYQFKRNDCSNITVNANTNDMSINVDADGSYDFYWNGYEKKLSITYPAQCTSCCGSDIFRVAGSENLCGSEWNGNDDNNIMECSDDIFSKSFNITGNTSYTFKIVKNSSDWINTIYSNASITNKIALTTTGDNSNVTLSENPSSDGKLTIYYDPNNGIYATFEKSCNTPTAGNFTYTAPQNLVYNNETKAATVVWNGTQGGTITVKYSSTSNKYTAATPKDAGTYYVFVSTVENDNYCAVTDLYINTFKIAKATQTALSISTDADVCGKSVTLATSGGTGAGTVTYSISGTNNIGASISGTTLSATSSGSVNVKATKSGGTNYNDATVEKTFNFTMPIENVKLAVKNTSVKASYCKDENITLVLTYDGPTPDFNNNEFEWVFSGIQTGTQFIGDGTNGINSGSEFTLQLGGVGVNKVGVKLKGCNGWVTSTDENSVNVTVNALPSAPTFTSNEATVCSGVAFNLNDKFTRDTGEAGILTWYKSSDNSQVTDPASVTITEATSYYAKATNNNCTSDESLNCTVNVDANPTLELESTPTVCPNVEIDLDDYATYNTGTLTWYSNQERTNVITDGLVTPTERTTYYAKVTNGTCNPVENEFTVDVYGIADEMPAYTQTKATKCKDEEVNSDGIITLKNPMGGVTYTLDDAEGESNVWTGLSAGTHKLSATVNACPSLTEKWDIEVGEEDITPSATVTITGDASFCEGGSTELTCVVNATKGNPTAYQWYNGEELIQGATASTYTANAAGNYKVVVTVNNNHCVDTFEATKEVSVKNKPTTPEFNPDFTSICVGGSTTLASGYNWYTDLNASALANLTVSPQTETTYYAIKEEDGCTSDAGTFTVKVNPLPEITSISASNDKPVLFEDVELTATGENIDKVEWTVNKGTITEDATDPKKAILTYDQTGTVTVTATATSAAGCKSTAATKTVKFSEEDCESTTRNDLIITCNPNGYYGDVYLHIWPNDEGPLKQWPGYKGEWKDDAWKWEIPASSLSTLKQYDIIFNNNAGAQTQDLDHNLVPGNQYNYTLNHTDWGNDKNRPTMAKVNPIPLSQPAAITAPAVKTVSVTSDEDGNVTMVGQVVKTGCDTQAILGLQYKKQKQDGTYDDNYTTYPNSGTKEAISAGKTFTVTTKLEDGTYKVRARIDNSHATNGYGEDIIVVVNTTKTPISDVTLDYCNEDGEDIDDPNPMCKGAIAYVKLSYEGSKYSDIKWLVEGVETNLVTDEGDGVWSYEIQGNGSLSVELKNDANTDPTWPYSNKLPFTIIPEPTAPTLQPITVCPQVGFDLTEKSGWTAPDDESLSISWYEKSDEEYVAVNSAKLLNQGITQATTYYARVQNKETGCYSAYVSMSVSVATVSKLTITPATGTTTPWVPISYTVDTNETFEMSYPDGLTSLPNIEITQSNGGKTYTYKIPRPTDWGTGNASPARSPKTYTIQAMLSGSSAECPSIGTATVTLNDEANDKCTK